MISGRLRFCKRSVYDAMRLRVCRYRILAILLWASIGVSTLPAAAGGYGESLLRIGVGARSLAMGGAFVPIADDGTAAYWNPAGLALIRAPQITATHAFLFETLADHSFVNASIPLGHGYTVGFSLVYLKVDDISGFDAATPGRGGAGPLPGNDSEQVYILSLAKMYAFDTLSGLYGSFPIEIPIAVNVKYLHQSIGNGVSNGMGIDAGMMARIGLNEGMRVNEVKHLAMGLSIRDLTGTYVRAKGRNETIKPSVRLGFSYTQSLSWLDGTLVVSEQQKLYNAERFLIGAEYWYRHAVAVRLGGYGRQFTTGCGLIVGSLMLDYAFVNQRSRDTHRLSASLRF